MEGNAHLLQVIRKMRSHINKLERENRALRGELQVCGQGAAPLESGAVRGDGNSDERSLADNGEGPAGPPASLHGSITAALAPAPKEQTDTTMTVRRYPTAPSHRLPGSAQPPATQLARGEENGLEKMPANCVSYSHSSKMKLFQEHVCKCRSKVKAVSFLLPMDTSSYAEKQGFLKSPQNQSTKQLTTITEKDM
ncbi:putative coiled-coil domain-containing protein 195 [Pterocles gutturalis]